MERFWFNQVSASAVVFIIFANAIPYCLLRPYLLYISVSTLRNSYIPLQ